MKIKVEMTLDVKDPVLFKDFVQDYTEGTETVRQYAKTFMAAGVTELNNQVSTWIGKDPEITVEKLAGEW